MIRLPRLGLLLVLILVMQRVAVAQLGGLGGVGGGGGGAANGGGGGGGGNQNASGIKIDSQGVMNLVVIDDSHGALDKKRRESIAKKKPSSDFHQKSKLRMVSLVQLEQQLEQRFSKQQDATEELFYLAGLQRIDYVFVFPDEHDLIIAGPAEGFVPDVVGRMIGVESGRPVLRLDDLFVALRTITKSKQVGCSIDPVPARLAELQNFIRQGGPATIEEVEARFNRMDDILGLQIVRIDGLPADSHFATMLVEVDFHMKMIAAGLETLPVKGLKSYLAMLGARGNTMQRWWFVPSYESISKSADGLAFQFAGQRAQLLTEEELVDAQGNRSSAPTTKKSVQAFAKQFTEKFPLLADHSPVFGELQNLIDWTIFAALLKHEQIPERIGWKLELLLDESRLGHPVFEVPKKVPSSVTYKRVGNLVVGMVTGGVVLHPEQNYNNALSVARDSTSLNTIRKTATPPPQPETHPWWWDPSPQASSTRVE